MKTKKKILVVDDDARLTEMLKTRLEANNYEVIVAYDGDEGLKKARQHKPDLIILDILMPKMAGDFMASALKGDADTSDIPIIFLTCLADGLSERQQSCMSGGNLFLAKPFDAQELLIIIERTLKKH